MAQERKKTGKGDRIHSESRVAGNKGPVLRTVLKLNKMYPQLELP